MLPLVVSGIVVLPGCIGKITGMDRGPDEEDDSGATSGDGATGTVKQDRDGDGVEDSKDAFPDNRREAYDRDGDGVGDNADDCDDDPKGWKDPDRDGACEPSESSPEDGGTESPGATESPGDAEGSKDSDGDGFANDNDAFPDDKNEWKDSDGDGVGDNGDAFPADPGESRDSDGDGVGDNEQAREPQNRPPVFPSPMSIKTSSKYSYDEQYGLLNDTTTHITIESPPSDPDGDPLTYAWTVAQNRYSVPRSACGEHRPGTIEGSGLEATWYRGVYCGKPAAGNVTVAASDGRGGSASYTLVFEWGAG